MNRQPPTTNCFSGCRSAARTSPPFGGAPGKAQPRSIRGESAPCAFSGPSLRPARSRPHLPGGGRDGGFSAGATVALLLMEMELFTAPPSAERGGFRVIGAPGRRPGGSEDGGHGPPSAQITSCLVRQPAGAGRSCPTWPEARLAPRAPSPRAA